VERREAGVSCTSLLEYFDSEMEIAEIEVTIASMWWRLMRRLKFKTLSATDVAGIECNQRRFCCAHLSRR
jgi:hypothetical protein